MKHVTARTALLLAVLSAAALPVAATPGFWEAATQADFLRGEFENLSIDEHGRLMLGPEVERVHDAGIPFVWTMVPGREGAVLLGTGNEGKVVRVDAKGNASVFYDSDEMEVHALAAGADGTVYVGTSPDGRVYRVDPKGNAVSLFDPEDKYIWALAVDPKGVVYAATGDKGVVYRITPDGNAESFFTTKTTHALALAFDPAGNLVIGTGSPGRVFRVDGQGKGFLVLDTPYQEVRALRFDDKGVLYAAAQSGRAAAGGEGPDTTPSEPPAPAAVPSVSTEITSIAIIDVPVSPQPSSSPAPSGDRRGPTGAVYRVLPDGLWDQLWESQDDAPYDVAVDPDGSLVVATGSKGKLFRLSGDPMRPTLLTSVDAQQVVTLRRGAAGRTLLATSNPGQLLALSADRATRGTYESDVKDARVVASWGTITWRAATPAGTRVELQTRSGNTRTPDEAWSDWSAPYTNADGSAITSPNARYLQWRATLTGKGATPVLTSITAAYLQRNIRPNVASITVHPAGVVFQKPFSSGETEIAGFAEDTVERRMAAAANAANSPGTAPTLGRRTYEKGLQTFIWKAEDENGDDLVYDVLYRREGETTWKLLKGGLTETILVWDTASAPNGSYVIKVVASDHKSNPPDTALRGERESASFDVDNTAPIVAIGATRREQGVIVVPFEVRDADSAITRVEYSVDSQPWQSVFPQDGILDARREEFVLRLDASMAGRTLVVRGTDTMTNVGSGEIVLK